jgi:Kef-type K+ transport system membrane component KefB
LDNPFGEIALLLVIAAAAGAVAVKLRQPVIIAFIFVGILVGPAGLGFTAVEEQVELLAGLGVTILLFLVGLKLDLGLVKNFGPVALATGLGQLTFTIGFGYLIALGLGLDATTSVYVAVALTFSSTIIIVKLLTDKRELDSLHGRVAIGFLIVQDIAVVVAMAVLVATDVGQDTGQSIVFLPLYLVGGALAIGVLMRYVLPFVLHTFARSSELLVIFAFAWGTFLAAGGDALGLSRELGAFIAGFSLASTQYREAIGARLTSLRDFLLLFFFVDLANKLEFVDVGQTALQASALSFFILVGNPLIVLAIMGALGYRKRTGFLAGLTVAQISEFSLIFIGLGVTLGHIEPEVMGLVTLIGIVTITASTYMILYSQRIYPKVQRWLSVFERPDPFRERALEESLKGETREVDVVVFGLGRYGYRLVSHLQDSGCRVLGVDFDPQRVREAKEDDMRVVFGDAADPEFPSHLSLGGVSWVVSTVADRGVNIVLLHALEREGYQGKVAVTAHREDDARTLEQAGAEAVLLPFADAAVAAADLVTGRGETE